MARIVQKFGGTSVGDIDRIKKVALRVKAEVDQGNEVAVVVSAMSGVTNQLVDYCSQVAPMHDAREYDMIVSTGEQVTSGLLALALQEMGVQARSWSGWQIPMITDNAHGKARIMEIKGEELVRRMEQGQVAVVAGFQGIGPDNRVTTLGRGGSDTTAVALAAAINADRCDIYTDVEGIYTTDPRIVSVAKKLNKITYEEMLEMASLGAKVLQTRSVEMAMKHRVRVQVLSSFSDAPGTLVCEAKVTILGVEDQPGIAAGIFGPLADANINVDMIVQNASEDGTTDITFTTSRAELHRALKVVKDNMQIPYRSINSDKSVVKVSVVGVGMRSHAGVAQTMFTALADKKINIHIISTSEIKVSVLISEDYTELALRALHTAYGLDAA